MQHGVADRSAAEEDAIDPFHRLQLPNPDEIGFRYPHQVSGGQLQRNGIARALAAEPDFIICDEVTSALDQLVVEGILKLLDRLQEQLDIAYMFITHDLATVKSMADEVVVMKEGRVVEAEPKISMFTPPHHDCTDLLLSSVSEMEPKCLDELLEKRAADGKLSVSAGNEPEFASGSTEANGGRWSLLTILAARLQCSGRDRGVSRWRRGAALRKHLPGARGCG